MSNSQSNGKRIVKNTIMLYFRSIVVMVISIYSSRVLLKTLGVDDFGLYNVVGGVVAMFGSLKSVLASAVQRFLNFEKGKNNPEAERRIFNMSVLIHLGLAILFGLLLEIFGLWYINSYLVIPAGSISTAIFVFHCSVVASMIAIYTIPYDAVVIANERMNFYAWQSIADISLRLLIIFALPVLPFERVRTYAVLILVIALVIRTISVIYTKQFQECRKMKYWNKDLFKELVSFAGWNFLGCASYSLVEEGSNLILNIFGGVVANAARSLSYQVRSAIMTLSNNILVASQPFITQQAATADRDKFWKYIFSQARFMYFIMLLTSLPIYVFAEQLLKLWLTEIPDNTIQFVRAIMIYAIVSSIQKSLDLSFKAFNKMSHYQIVDATIIVLTLPCVYLVLNFGAPLYYAFIIFSVIRIIDYFAVVYIAKIKIGLNVPKIMQQVLVPMIRGGIIFVVITVLFQVINIEPHLLNLLCGIILLEVVGVILVFLAGITKVDRDLIISSFRKFIVRG